MSNTATATMSPMLAHAFEQVQQVAPGRLGLHGRSRLPHIVDVFVDQDEKIVPGVSIIGGDLAKVISLAAAFDPEVISWTGAVNASEPDAPMFYMTVASQKGSMRTVQAGVPFRRDDAARKLSMAERTVQMTQAPAQIAAGLTAAMRVAPNPMGAAQEIHESRGEIGLLVYPGTSISAVLAPLLHRNGWTKTADGAVFNAAGSTAAQERLLRGLSVTTAVSAFRAELLTGAGSR